MKKLKTLGCLAIVLFILWGFGYIVTQFRMSRMPPPIPEPTYSPEFVRDICAVFAIPPDDSFCSDLALTADAVSLKNALQRTYPTDDTITYAELQPLLAQVGETSRCLDSRLIEGCPPPDDCSRMYTCFFSYASPTGEELSGSVDFFDSLLINIGINRRAVESR